MLTVLLTMLLANFTCFGFDANCPPKNVLPVEQENVVQIPKRDYSKMSVGVKITAQAALVQDLESSVNLFAKNINQQLPLASITKLMTVLVFLDFDISFDQKVVMQAKDEVYKAKYVYRGEQVTVKDLLHLSLLGSDNNATRALVRVTGLSASEFIALMNDKAKNLGMTKSVFVDTTGLAENNISTAKDIATLAKAVWSQEEIFKISGLFEYVLKVKNNNRSKRIFHTNKLENSFLDIKAGKTGFTDEAGYCLVTKTINNDQSEIITVVLGSREEEDRFQDTKAIVWWTFNNYIW